MPRRVKKLKKGGPKMFAKGVESLPKKVPFADTLPKKRPFK